jgi:hypothetical protein
MDCMGFRIIGNLHVVVLGEKDPSGSDWKTYLDAIISAEKSGIDVTARLRTLVFSDGAGPNAQQRKAVADYLKGRPSPLAIVTGVTIMRGVITALGWFNPQVKAFAPDQLDEALRYLDVPLIKRNSILTDAHEIQSELKIPKIRAIEAARLRYASA